MFNYTYNVQSVDLSRDLPPINPWELRQPTYGPMKINPKVVAKRRAKNKAARRARRR
jgi:hypothetical protein